MKLSFILLFILILIFLALNLPHLLEFTPVWPDEAWIADVALNILRTGRPSTEIWGNMIPGATEHVLWYPPLFLYLLSFWFKLFGFSIINQRLLSIAIGIVFSSIFFIFLKVLISKWASKLSGTKVSLLAFLGSLLLIIDPIFLKSSVISRPEILVLTLVIFSALFIFKALDSKLKVKSKMLLIVTGGLLSGASILVHFLAGIFLIALALYALVSSKKFFFEKSLYIFIASALIPIIVWILIILPDLNILKSHLEIFAQDRSLTPGYLNLPLLGLPLMMRISFVIYFIVTLAIFTFYLLTRKSNLLLVSLISIASWLFAYYGKIEWYAVYIAPFVYIALILLLVYSNENKKNATLKDLKFSTILVLVVLFIIDLNNYINIFSSTTNKSYFEFEKKVNSVVPRGKTVYLSSIPDVYYKFKSDGSYKLYRSPLFRTDTDTFRKVLDELDYVIINYSLVDKSISDLLDSFLKENATKQSKISSGGYSVFVYELKKNQIP